MQIICRKTVNGQTERRSAAPPQPGPGATGAQPGQMLRRGGRVLLPLVRHCQRSAAPASRLRRRGRPRRQRAAGDLGPTAAEVSRLTAAVKASQVHTLDSFKIESALALGLLTIVSFGLSWWMAGRVLRPVHRITDTARSLSERTLHARINLQGPNDELKQLADTFDAMLGRSDRAFHSQRRFVANASHELRTPLATERVLIDEALANRSASPDELRSILEQLRANSEETERLIDALLLLARSERGIERWSPVELPPPWPSVVDQSAGGGGRGRRHGVVRSRARRGERGSGSARTAGRQSGRKRHPPQRYRRLGRGVRPAVRSRRTPCWKWSTPGRSSIPRRSPAWSSRSGGLGRTAAPTTAGVGLGLSIVNAIVTAHHGTMALRARPEGGLHVRVQLPVASS